MTRLVIFLILVLTLPSFYSFVGSDDGSANILSDENITRGQLTFDDTPYEYRSMWVEGYQIVNISEVKAVVDLARRYNFNVLSPLINGDYRGVFYNSSYFNKHPDIRWDFDPLMELIREAHKYGIQVHPWWHTLYNYPALIQHPEWRCQTSGGTYSWAWINPAIPQARSYVRNFTLEVINNYPIDGIKLDTIRYGGSSYSYDAYSLAKFAEEDGVDFNRWRRNQISKTVELIYDSVMKVKPWFWIGADVFSSSWGRMTGVFQEPELWADDGFIDYITPMIYTTSVTSYNSSLASDVNGVNCPVVGGTYIYIPGNTAHGSVPDAATGIQTMLEQVVRAQKMGAWGVCCFAYKFLRQYPAYGQALLDGPFEEKARCPIKEQNIASTSRNWQFEKDQDREGWNLFDAGFFYPNGGVWSVSRESSPKFLSPRMNFTSDGINVIEISALIEQGKNCSLEIYWGQMAAVMDPTRMISREIQGNGDWNIYSIHLDDNVKWSGVISYILIVPTFSQKENITIDLISLHWMPKCISTCSYLGPFTIGGDNDLLERNFIDNEGNILPRLGDIESGRTWSDFTMERDLLDFRFPLGRKTYTVVYSHVYVYSVIERTVDLKIGTSDGLKAWLNGDMIINSTMPRSVSPDLNTSRTSLLAGFNSLFIKMAVYENEFSYYARFTDTDNNTLDDLSYLNDIPCTGAPGISIVNGTWFDQNSISVLLTEPDSVIDIDGYEINIDGEQVIYSETTTFEIEGMKDGDHNLTVTAIDQLGFRSNSVERYFRIDTAVPIILGPYIESEYTTNTSIQWKWNIDKEPISGIEHFEIDINFGPMNDRTGSTLGPFMIHGNEFTLDTRISDGYSYFAKVSAVTGSGKRIISNTSQPVVVDLFAPVAPTQFSSSMVEGTNRTYQLLWNDVLDNIPGGLDRYVVTVRYGEGEDTETYESKTNSIFFQRPIGKDPIINIHGIDSAGNIGTDSADFTIDNYSPVLNISTEQIFQEGDVIVIDSKGSYDPDGVILNYIWKIDGELVSNDPVLRMTLEEGRYLLELSAIDDLGMRSVKEYTLILDKNELMENNTIREWLIELSFKDQQLPVINITIPVYPELEPEKTDILVSGRASIIRILLIIVISIFLLSILVFMGYSIRRKLIVSQRDFIVETLDPEEGNEDGKAGFSFSDKSWLFNRMNMPEINSAPQSGSFQPASIQMIDTRSIDPEFEDDEYPDEDMSDFEEEDIDGSDQEIDELSMIEDWDELDEFNEEMIDEEIVFIEEGEP